MTVITYYNSSGERRRCDAHCHNATNYDCNCICCGVLHGSGRQTAQLGRRLSRSIDRIFGVHAPMEQMEPFPPPSCGSGRKKGLL
jgi:hypothetical protein